MKTKVITIISNTNNALAFEWCAKYLNKDIFELQFIFLNPSVSSLELNLKKNGYKTSLIKYRNKTIIPFVFIKVMLILIREKPQIVHTHLFEASLIGLFAARLVGIKKRIYTRHHSNSNRAYFPKAVKYDLFINNQSTSVIAISKNVKDILVNEEHVPAEKISIINHGLDFSLIKSIDEERINKIRVKHNIDKGKVIVGVISRYIHLKGIQYIIPAFNELLKMYPNAILVLANAKGNYSNQIKNILNDIPIENYVEIEFEEDLFALYKLFDIYIHAPIDENCEAFGQTYIEALACKVPSIFTLSGIAPDFVVDRKNALVVPFQNSGAIYRAMIELLHNKKLCKDLTEQGRVDVECLFNIKNIINDLETLYLSL